MEPLNDRDLALARLRALTGGELPQPILVLVHEGQPISKGRPRFGGRGGHPFTPKRTRDAERDLAWALAKARGPVKTLTGPVAMVAMFYMPTRRRTDADNCVKLLADSATKAHVWADDSQIRAQTIVMELDRDHPRTVVALCPYLVPSQAPLLIERTD